MSIVLLLDISIHLHSVEWQAKCTHADGMRKNFPESKKGDREKNRFASKANMVNSMIYSNKLQFIKKKKNYRKEH